jgi:hypothetical protein
VRDDRPADMLVGLTTYIRYPAALGQHMHRAKAYLPIDIARALLANPSLVQRAVEAFYTRDAIQLRVIFQQSSLL